ncbi:MAG: M48 family metallopeptidase [Deltaproteobacteria bacterium]|nr:M48 family metallopeptidase [Deltaproteobacteria bacterium]
MSISFDFRKWIKDESEQRRRGDAAHPGGYAYTADEKVRRVLGALGPVKLATEATVRLWNTTARADLLGSAVRVGPNQFKEIHELVSGCARTLGIAMPAVYIQPNPGAVNAMTLGTEDDGIIIITSAAVDHMSPEELRFIVGHECGHIQHGHVTYMTVLHYLMNTASYFLRWIVTPALMALNSWKRRAEVTCDRAGLVCVGDLDLAVKTLVKLALGSQKLYDQINMDEYLKQLDDLRGGVGQYAEFNKSHPYLPKRVKALQLFAKSLYFRVRVLKKDGGLPKEILDERVSEVLGVG